MEKNYTAYTDEGHWDFYAADHMDAMRKALWFCFRDGEMLRYVVTPDLEYLRICALRGCHLRVIE